MLGISAPLILVFSIWRSSAQNEVEATELFEAAERFSLPGPGQGTEEKLPTEGREALPADTDSEPPPDRQS